MPGIPTAPSIPSGTAGHTSHGSPCPEGAVTQSSRLGVRGTTPAVPRGRGMCPWPPWATLSPHPPCLLSAPGHRGDPAGGKVGTGPLQGGRGVPHRCHPAPLRWPPAASRDDPSPERGRRFSQSPLGSRARIPSPLRPSSPDPEPRNPALTPGFGCRLLLLTGVPGDPPGPGAPGLPWSQRWENRSSARGNTAALGPL